MTDETPAAQPPQPQREATEADHQAVQAILDCWFNREEILSIVVAHRLSTLPAAASVEAGEIIEMCAKAVDGERLVDHTDHPEDLAYNRAIDDAITAIRALTAKGKDQADG